MFSLLYNPTLVIMFDLTAEQLAYSPSPALSPSPSQLPPLDWSGLSPVRSCLQSFWDERDVAMLLRVSHSTSLHLLTGYSFDKHIFVPEVRPNPPSTASPPDAGWLNRLLPNFRLRPTTPPPALAQSLNTDTLLFFCSRYSLHIRRLQLPKEFDGPLIDETTGHSLLPQTLTQLWLGWSSPEITDDQQRGEKAFDCVDDHASPPTTAASADPPSTYPDPFSVVYGGNVEGAFNHTLSIGCLSEGLRILYFGQSFNQPLLAGSLPSSLTFCDFSCSRFTQPIDEGVLPSQLRDLLLSDDFNQPLQPGVLPSSLRRLLLGVRYNQPLAVGALPSQLLWLEMGQVYNQPIPPGVLPQSCTVLHLSRAFNQPLTSGCLPDGLLHLNMGEAYNEPLEPGVLPRSLLYLCPSNNVSLLPGVIPPRLTRLHLQGFRGPLVTGCIPPSVREVDVADERMAEVRALVPPLTLINATNY